MWGEIATIEQHKAASTSYIASVTQVGKKKKKKGQKKDSLWIVAFRSIEVLRHGKRGIKGEGLLRFLTDWRNFISPIEPREKQRKNIQLIATNLTGK